VAVGSGVPGTGTEKPDSFVMSPLGGSSSRKWDR
jgi:hypothetical protein